MYLFGGAVFFFGFSALFLTTLSFWVMIKRDKHVFYYTQWNDILDSYSKYEYIIDQWCKAYRIDLCNDIHDLIFEYTNCMCHMETQNG